MYGIGTWKFMDHVYEGEFEQNKKSGKGTMKYFTDNEYCGDWENDLPCKFKKFNNYFIFF